MSRLLSLLLVPIVLAGCRSSSGTSTSMSSSSQPAESYDVDSLSEPTRQDRSAADITDRATARTWWNDDDFVRQAIRVQHFEIEASRLAVEKASAGPLRDLAAKRVEEHAATRQALDELVQRKRVSVRQNLDAAQEERLAQLKELEGPGFDVKYREMLLASHDEAIALFEGAARQVRDPEIKSYAVETLSSLRERRTLLLELPETLEDDETSESEE